MDAADTEWSRSATACGVQVAVADCSRQLVTAPDFGRSAAMDQRHDTRHTVMFHGSSTVVFVGV